MKRLLIPLLLAVLASSAAALIPRAGTEIECPVGGEKFWAQMYDDVPYQICPGNKLVFKTDRYGKFTPQELARYRRIVNSQAYRSLPKNAGDEYYLAAFAELSGEYSASRVGYLYFEAANGAADLSRIEKQRLYAKAFRYLKQALRETRDPVELNNTRYALANMYRISGDFAQAGKILQQLQKQPLSPRNRKQLEYVLESVRLKDRGHILSVFDGR